MELNWRNRFQIFLSKKKTMESLPCLLLAIDGILNYLNLKQNNLMELTCYWYAYTGSVAEVTCRSDVCLRDSCAYKHSLHPLACAWNLMKINNTKKNPINLLIYEEEQVDYKWLWGDNSMKLRIHFYACILFVKCVVPIHV